MIYEIRLHIYERATREANLEDERKEREKINYKYLLS